MAIKILAIGDSTYSFYKEGENEYLKRLARYTRIEYEVIKDVKKTGKMNPTKIKEEEEAQFFKRIKPTDHVILLDEGGKQFSSVQLSKQLENWMSHHANIVFVIGGAFGFSDKMYERATSKLSLSSLTLSHQMVRMFFFEQLYRCFTILNGEPYHNN